MSEKILFVDDSPVILKAFQAQLRNRYSVSVASCGQVALDMVKQEVLRKDPFTVIVSDMRMPGMDGITFLKKAEDISPDSILMMLTANGDQKTAIDAVNDAHVFRFITKPCQSTVLTQSIDAALIQARLIQSDDIVRK
jgi:DNA-binding NtrC family response regulator